MFLQSYESARFTMYHKTRSTTVPDTEKEKNSYVYLFISYYEALLFSFLNRSVSARFTMCSKKNRVCIFHDIILWDPPPLFVYLLAVPCAATHGAQLSALCKTQEREHIYKISTQICVATIIWICSLYHVPQNTEHNWLHCAGRRKGNTREI